ncbi:MAG: hypothetical protein MZV63_37450 [Marinilabiliales bacterium]|nr:hypothetical protein [Marinilabiliales bacterium]
MTEARQPGGGRLGRAAHPRGGRARPAVPRCLRGVRAARGESAGSGLGADETLGEDAPHPAAAARPLPDRALGQGRSRPAPTA